MLHMKTANNIKKISRIFIKMKCSLRTDQLIPLLKVQSGPF